MKHINRLLILLFMFGLMIACKKENQPPTIISITANVQSIKTGETAELTCVATDSDNNQLTYFWPSSNGIFPNGTSGSSVLWEAPEEPGNYIVSVLVNDGYTIVSRDTSILVEQKLFGTFIDSRDNHEYKWVRIGEQVWMAENLAFLPAINTLDDPNPFDHSTNFYVYGYNGRSIEDAKATYNYKTYGVLYTWYAALESCPDGWHLSTANEWEQLAQYISNQKGPYGMIQNPRGYGVMGWEMVGNHLKTSQGWCHSDRYDNNGSDDFNFSALPGGELWNSNEFHYIGCIAHWWCENKASRSIWDYGFDYSSSTTNTGCSVRCVKD